MRYSCEVCEGLADIVKKYAFVTVSVYFGSITTDMRMWADESFCLFVYHRCDSSYRKISSYGGNKRRLSFNYVINGDVERFVIKGDAIEIISEAVPLILSGDRKIQSHISCKTSEDTVICFCRRIYISTTNTITSSSFADNSILKKKEINKKKLARLWWREAPVLKMHVVFLRGNADISRCVSVRGTVVRNSVVL